MFKKDDVIYNWRTKRVATVIENTMGDVYLVTDNDNTPSDYIVDNGDWILHEAYKRYIKLEGIYGEKERV